MFLIIFTRYSTHLMSELSFYTAWDETVHMAASHGVSVVRLPPTKLRASALQSSLVQLVFEPAPAEGSSFLFHHSSTPFTSQNSVYDFMTASRRKSSWVIPSSRNTKVVLPLDASVNGAARSSLLSKYQTVSGYKSESGFIQHLRNARNSLGRFSPKRRKNRKCQTWLRSHVSYRRANERDTYIYVLKSSTAFMCSMYRLLTDTEFRENRSRSKVRVEVILSAYARCD